MAILHPAERAVAELVGELEDVQRELGIAQNQIKELVSEIDDLLDQLAQASP